MCKLRLRRNLMQVWSRLLLSAQVGPREFKLRLHVPPFSGTWSLTASLTSCVCIIGLEIANSTLWPFLGIGKVFFFILAALEGVNYLVVLSALTSLGWGCCDGLAVFFARPGLGETLIKLALNLWSVIIPSHLIDFLLLSLQAAVSSKGIHWVVQVQRTH
jgi:hypothetical protein